MEHALLSGAGKFPVARIVKGIQVKGKKVRVNVATIRVRQTRSDICRIDASVADNAKPRQILGATSV